MGYMPVIWLVIGVLWWTNGCIGSEHGIQACYMAGYRCVMGPDVLRV